MRLDPKGFTQRRSDGAGGWVYNLNGIRRVPYRLPELLAADPSQPVFIVEGEKDADRLAGLGLVATTNAGGAGKWLAEFAEYLRGFNVVILPDNDKPGENHATKVAQSLRGFAASVRVLRLPNLPPKGDVSDWLDAGHTTAELLALTEAVPESSSRSGEDRPLNVVRMSDVEPEEVRWLWYPYIPLGKLTMLEGDPGLGKSWLTCALAAAVTCGRGLPGAEPFAPGNVLMLSAEDGLGDTLRPRLDAVGADVSRVFALSEPTTFDVPGLLRLEAMILECSPSLVIIDPLFAFTGGKVDIHRANECRAISAPLAAIAERTGCALLAVRHLGKSRGGGHALNAGIGSIDFTAAARSVLLVGQDPDEPTKRAVVQSKNKRPRTIPMTTRVRSEVLAVIQDRTQGPVFLSARTGVNLVTIKKGFKRACELAGIPHGQNRPGGLTFHDLRHTFATRLAEREVGETQRLALLGQSSTKMVRRYSHATPEALREAVARLEHKAGDVLEFWRKAG